MWLTKNEVTSDGRTHSKYFMMNLCGLCACLYNRHEFKPYAVQMLVTAEEGKLPKFAPFVSVNDVETRCDIIKVIMLGRLNGESFDMTIDYVNKTMELVGPATLVMKLAEEVERGEAEQWR